MKDFIIILSEFLRRIGVKLNAESLVNDIIIIIFGIGVLYFIINYLWKAFKLIILKYGKYQFQKIVPYFSSFEIKAATKLYINTMFQDIDPATLEEPLENQYSRQRSNLIKNFISKIFVDKNQNEAFFLVLGDTGLGKTTFLINLFIKYKQKFTFFNVIPYKYKIRLYPLNNGEFNSFVNLIGEEEKNKTILLIDAFDEDIKAQVNVSERIDEIIELSKNFKFVIITSRTQFFNSQEEIPKYTKIHRSGGSKGLYQLVKFYISPLTNKEIKKYINRRFSIFNRSKRNKANSILKHSPYLLARPMLLTQIDDLLDIDKSKITQLDIYRHLVNKWIDRESINCGQNFEKCKDKLLLMVLDIAIYIYKNPQANRYKYSIHIDNIKAISSRYSIDIEKFSQDPKTILNRNADNYFKFAHKSIYEFLLARQASVDFEFYKYFDWNENSFSKELFELMSLEITVSSEFKDLNPKNKELYKKFISEISRMSKCEDILKLKAVHLCIGTNQLSTEYSCNYLSEINRSLANIELKDENVIINNKGVRINDNIIPSNLKHPNDEENLIELNNTKLEIFDFNKFVNEQTNILFK